MRSPSLSGIRHRGWRLIEVMNSRVSEKRFSLLRDDSGAALPSAIMVAALLGLAVISIIGLVAGGSRDITDYSSVVRARNAAESGMQMALNVLRGNSVPITAYPPEIGNSIDFRKATHPQLSNQTGDGAQVARLSKWIDYNFNPNAGGFPDRFVFNGLGEDYVVGNGDAFSLELSDPDDTDAGLSYSMILSNAETPAQFCSGVTYCCKTTFNASMTQQVSRCTSLWSETEVKVDLHSAVPVTFGPEGGTSATVPLMTVSVRRIQAIASFDFLRFNIVFQTQSPRPATRIIRGRLRGVPNWQSIQVVFEPYVYELEGGQIKLCKSPACELFNSNFTLAVPTTTTTTNSHQFLVNLTPMHPSRMILKSTGFGPGGARSVLESVLRKSQTGRVEVLGVAEK